TCDLLRLRRNSTIETTQNQERVPIRRRDLAFIRKASHRKTLFQQRRQRSESVIGSERLAAAALVEGDAQGGLLFEAHGSGNRGRLFLGGRRFLAGGQVGFEIRIEQSRHDFIGSLNSHIEYFRAVCRQR